MQLKNLVVVGSGLMGRGIAQVGALGGLPTAMVDVSAGQLDAAMNFIQRELAKAVQRKLLTQDQMDACLANLRPTTDLAGAARAADYAIEAVPENMALKHQVFRTLDEHCPAHSVLASNTSSMSITEIAAATRRPERCIGMHFFNPPHKMKLIEIIRGLETNDETFQISWEVCRLMGKEGVAVNEFPGFVTSRINVLIGNEAFLMLQEGVASAKDIDKALKLGLNHPMGPFELVDLVGLDTRYNVLKYLQATLGDKFRPAPLMEKYFKAGRLGRKVGRGVYTYDKEGNML